MSDFEVRSKDLGVLAKNLKEAGDGDLRKQLLAAIRKGAGKAIPDIRASASRTLPRRGGLAARVASQKFAVRTSLALGGGSVRIIGQGMKELGDLDRGSLRHPVYGDRSNWVVQSVVPGFFSKPITAKLPEIADDVKEAVDDVSRQIVRGV